MHFKEFVLFVFALKDGHFVDISFKSYQDVMWSSDTAFSLKQDEW